jgi:L-lactate dehydrogenase (cytochrome)
VTKPFWFQLYVMKDRAFVKQLIMRARACKVSALVVTVDLNVPAQRHADVKNGLTVPPRLTFKTASDMVWRVPWALSMLRTPHHTFGNLSSYRAAGVDMNNLASWIASQFDDSLTWSDIEWVKSVWGGPMVVKGIMCAEDAVLAVRSGADAIVVSNHGGRQQDGAHASISMLPAIVRAVAEETRRAGSAAQSCEVFE